MSRKFRGKLLAVSLLAFGAMTISTVGLTSCQPEEVQPSNVLEGVTGFSITNKDELTAAWRAGDGNRMLSLSFQGNSSVNPTQAINEGSIEISSSDATVATSFGLYIAALKQGSATITVTVHTDSGDLTDSFDLTIDKAFVAPEPTEVTVSELLDIDFDAWSATKPQPIYTVTGVVGDWYGKDGSNYGPVSDPTAYGNFYMSDPETGDEILVYGATLSEDALVFNSDGTWLFSNPEDFIADDGSTPVVKGDTVTLTVKLAEYNGTIQLNAVITDIEKGVQIDYESITVKAEDTTLDINDYTYLSEQHAPEDVNVGAVTYEVVEGSDVVELDGNKVIAKKAGTAQIVGKGGSVTSEPVTITVSSNEITYSTISSVYDAASGSKVAFYGKYMGTYAGEQNYGIFVGDGESAVFVYKGTAPEGVEVGDSLKVVGETDIYNGGFQIASGALVMEDTLNRGTTPEVLELTSLTGVDGKDTGREVSLTGTISEFAIDEQYGNVEFNVTIASGDKVYVKADSRYVPEATLTELSALKDGDTVNLKGNITFYVKGLSDSVPTNAEGLQVVNPSLVK